MDNKNDNVIYCGQKQWSIGVAGNGQIVVCSNRPGIFVELVLNDLSCDDCKNLAALFARHAVEPKT